MGEDEAGVYALVWFDSFDYECIYVRVVNLYVCFWVGEIHWRSLDTCEDCHGATHRHARIASTEDTARQSTDIRGIKYNIYPPLQPWH